MNQQRFRYRARDAEGNLQEGQMAADSSDDVKSFLRKRNWTPVAIARVASAPVSTHFRRSWKSRLTDLRFDSPPMLGFLVLLACLGIGWIFHGKSAPTRAQVAQVQQEASQTYEVTLQGRLRGRPPSNARLEFCFPDIPYMVTHRWEELDHPTPDSYRLPVKFKVRRSSTQCQLRLRVEGSETVAGQQVELVPATRELELPPLLVRS